MPDQEPTQRAEVPLEAEVPGGLAPKTQAAGYVRKQRTGLVTLLFTDIVGSVALKGELGDQIGVALIQRHHALLRELLGRFPEATEIATAGDSFLLEFTKPSEAVRFALVLQWRLRALGQQTGRAVEDRIGVHVGEVVIEEGAGPAKPKDLYGLQVDTCARVMSLAVANQILMTRFAFDSARQALKGLDLEGLGQLQWLNHGPYLFKGLEEPIEVCEARMGGGEVVTPPPSTEKARRYVSAKDELVLGWRPAVGQVVPGTRWGLEEKLGQGGFGEVWLGRHQRLKELRVFKFCFRADRVRGLKREMTLFRVLKERVGEHPHVARLLEVNLEQAPYYLEEEYVAGRDLRTWCLAQGGVDKVPLETRLEIAAQAAEGVAAAHAAGIIHRDVKPGNILVFGEGGAARDEAEPSPGLPPATRHPSLTVKLTDFGIGQVVSADCLAGVTATGMTQTILAGSTSTDSGTHAYTAPEVLMGRPASKQSDIYSLGVVLYQLAVADFTRPLTMDWARDVGDTVLQEDLQRCFAGRLEERFGDAAELARRLRALPERRAAAQKGAAQAAAAKAPTSLRPPPVTSLAVLPFVNMSPDPENEFLGDGIAEDLLTALSRVPGLRVPGRTSCFAFKGKTQDLRVIGQTLSVETVLEGSVRRAGNRLRITAQLIKVADGFHLWSERFDREMTDVFAVQDEITQAIVEALRIKLQPTILIAPGTTNLESFQLYLKGRYYCQLWTPEGFANGLALFEQALKRDPDYALAYTGIAQVITLRTYFGSAPPKQALQDLEVAVTRALELDENLAATHVESAFHRWMEWDATGAEKAFLRAQELEPNNPFAHHHYGMFLWSMQRHEQAVREIKIGLELDPLSPQANLQLCCPLDSLGRYEEALEQARKLIVIQPTFWGGYFMSAVAKFLAGRKEDAVSDAEKMAAVGCPVMYLGWLGFFYCGCGRTSDAGRVLEQVNGLATQRYVPATTWVWLHHGLGNRREMVAAFGRAVEEHSGELIFWKDYRDLFFRDDPDVRELVKQITL